MIELPLEEFERLHEEVRTLRSLLKLSLREIMTDETAQITQLQQQQSLFTQALKAMLEGRWVGENSVEAYLYALDPSMVDTIDYDIPVTESGESNP